MFDPILIIRILFKIYTVMIFVRIFASWIPDAQQYRFIRFIGFYTDPYLNLFRRVIPPIGMFDLSPIVAFICLGFIENALISLVGG